MTRILVAEDSATQAVQVRGLLEEANYEVDVVGNGREEIQDAFGPLWGIPVSVIIGRDGTIAKKHSGIGTREQFEQEIKALL